MSGEVEKNGDPESQEERRDAGNGVASSPPHTALQPEAAVAGEAIPAGGQEAPRPAVPPAAEQPSRKRGPVRRFIRTAVSHVVFAAIITAGVVGYLYQRDILNRLGDELCTEDRLGGYMTKALKPSELPAANVQRTAPPFSEVLLAPGPASSAAARLDEPAAEAAPGPQEPPAKAAVPAKPVAAAPEPAEMPHVPASPPVEAATAASSPQQAGALPAAQLSVPPANTAALTSTVATASSGAAKGVPDGMAAEWQAARQAAAAHRTEAEDLYRNLVARYPGIVDLRGEFGNVLYAMGRMKEAAEQYYEAALLQLKGPQPELAGCLKDVIEHIDPARAGMLQPQIIQPCPYKAR